MMDTDARTPQAGASHMLLACVHRLEEVLDQEIEALNEHRNADLPDCNRRKSRALLELTRIARTVPPDALDAGLRNGIAGLRAKLVRNRDLLQVHINAVREVADLLARVMTEQDSDGTYLSRPGRAQ
jgi:hypothetical protein